MQTVAMRGDIFKVKSRELCQRSPELVWNEICEFLCLNHSAHPSMLVEEFSVVVTRHKESHCP